MVAAARGSPGAGRAERRAPVAVFSGGGGGGPHGALPTGATALSGRHVRQRSTAAGQRHATSSRELLLCMKRSLASPSTCSCIVVERERDAPGGPGGVRVYLPV